MDGGHNIIIMCSLNANNCANYDSRVVVVDSLNSFKIIPKFLQLDRIRSNKQSITKRVHNSNTTIVSMCDTAHPNVHFRKSGRHINLLY